MPQIVLKRYQGDNLWQCWDCQKRTGETSFNGRIYPVCGNSNKMVLGINGDCCHKAKEKQTA